MKSIFVIGMGTGGKEGLPGRALSLVESAGLLVGASRHLDEFPVATGEKAHFRGLSDAASRIRGHLKKKNRGHVAVLATGDPLLFGIGSFILKEFGKDKVEIVPNVSAVQEAFARIGEDMNGVKMLSAHARAVDFDVLAAEAAFNERLALFTDGQTTPAVIARGLLERGIGGLRAFVCESLGSKGEKITEGALETVAKRRSFDALNVLILINDNPGRRTGGPGIPDSALRHASGMITKEEFRAVALSKLALGPFSVVWDIGACSGSVAIEAARLIAGRVFAVEKDGARVKDIEENSERFQTKNLVVVEGEAPAALRGLPSPDAVFVGGGGEGIVKILQAVSRRLKKGGRVVVSAVTMETASKAVEFISKKGWEKETVLLSVARSKDVAGLTMLSANNPIFMIRGRKPL